jgi:hypothetical protein
MHTPPARVDFHERRFAGVPWRDAGILAFSAVTALALFVLFPRVTFLPKAIAAIAIVAFGAGVAFFRPEGLTLEHWLLEVLAFRRRTRYRLKGVLKRAAVRVQLAGQEQETESEPEEPQTVEPESTLAAQPPPTMPVSPMVPRGVLVEQPAPLSAAVMLATLFMFSVLVSLTLYLANGGAERLYSLLKGI